MSTRVPEHFSSLLDKTLDSSMLNERRDEEGECGSIRATSTARDTEVKDDFWSDEPEEITTIMPSGILREACPESWACESDDYLKS